MAGSTDTTPGGEERNMGPQPLDALMAERGLDNHALVAASPAPLTHKQVQRARKGRRLTKNMQAKVLAAFQKAADAEATLASLFNYRGL